MGIFSRLKKIAGGIFRNVAKPIASTALKTLVNVAKPILAPAVALAEQGKGLVESVKDIPIVGKAIREGLEKVREGKLGGFLKDVVKTTDRVGKGVEGAGKLTRGDYEGGAKDIGKSLEGSGRVGDKIAGGINKIYN